MVPLPRLVRSIRATNLYSRVPFLRDELEHDPGLCIHPTPHGAYAHPSRLLVGVASMLPTLLQFRVIWYSNVPEE